MKMDLRKGGKRGAPENQQPPVHQWPSIIGLWRRHKRVTFDIPRAILRMIPVCFIILYLFQGILPRSNNSLTLGSLALSVLFLVTFTYSLRLSILLYMVLLLFYHLVIDPPVSSMLIGQCLFFFGSLLPWFITDYLHYKI